MTLPEIDKLDPLVLKDSQAAWAVREASTSEDVRAVITWYRNGEPRLGAMVARIDRDDMLTAARLGAAPTQADLIVLCTDTTYTERHLTNPLTGQAWGKNEMQSVREQDHLPGLLSAITTVASWSDGRFEHYIRPYVGYGESFAWRDDQAHFLEGAFTGYIADFMTDLWSPERMSTYSLRSSLDGLGLDYDPAREDELGQAVAVQVLQATGVVAGVMSPDIPEATEEAIQRSMTSPLGIACISMGVARGWRPLSDLMAVVGEAAGG